MRFAFLLSGGGAHAWAAYRNWSNLTNGDLSLVVCDRSCGAYELFCAKTRVPTVKYNYSDFSKKEELEKRILEELQRREIDWVILNYRRLLGKTLIEPYANRIFNLHQSLLPLFPGLRSLERSFESGILCYGATIHVVDKSVDGGPILSQVVLAKDREEGWTKFRHRHFQNSTLLQCDLVKKLSEDELIVDNGKFFFRNALYGCLPFNPCLSIDAERIHFE